MRKGFLLLGTIIFLILSYLGYKNFFENNIRQIDFGSHELFIRDNATILDIDKAFDTILCDPISWKWFRNIYRFTTPKPGKYILKAGMSNHEILLKLRSGSQDAVKLSIHSVRDIPQLAGKLSRFLQSDSLTFLHVLTDTTLMQRLGYNKEDFLCLFLPNTYEVYWTIKPEKFVQRMAHEHKKFWEKKGNFENANMQALSPKEVYILASIVEKESTFESERPAIAGVYLNRLKSGMKLQADPTVVFALGLFAIQRVLLEHLKYPSPYNTYFVEGLPPGPICMPSMNSIQSVLNAENHDFLFFCAKPGYEGSHAFASSLKAHYENARIYRQWLDEENIK